MSKIHCARECGYDRRSGAGKVRREKSAPSGGSNTLPFEKKKKEHTLSNLSTAVLYCYRYW